MLPLLALVIVAVVTFFPALAGALLGPVIPLTTGYLASSYGRSFRKWTVLGSVLPVLSILVLLLLPDRSAAGQVRS